MKRIVLSRRFLWRTNGRKKSGIPINNLLSMGGGLMAAAMISSCNGNGDDAGAWGNIEADEVTVSSQANGQIISFQLEEGQVLKAGDTVGCIDSTQLHLKRIQLLASRAAVVAGTGNVSAQLRAMDARLQTLEVEQSRVMKLLADSAATQQQLDQINGGINELIEQKAALRTKNEPILKQSEALDARIAQVADMIRRCVIINPVAGTVTAKFVNEMEITGSGRPLYTVADLRRPYLRAWIPAPQLSNLKLGQQITVRVDDTDAEYRSYTGKLAWISDQAEFTPKNIQTKEERTTEVYAVKVYVDNDGSLKSGMPGELVFSADE